MISWAVIRHVESDKNIGVLVHESEKRRLLFKVRPSDALFQKSLDILSERSVVVVEEDPGGFTKRRRVLKSDQDFLPRFSDRAVQHPYEVRVLESSEDERNSPDQVLDNLYEDFVSFQEPR